MDFTTLGRLIVAERHTSWGALLADTELIFTNAMSYNPAESIFHKKVCPMCQSALSRFSVASPRSLSF